MLAARSSQAHDQRARVLGRLGERDAAQALELDSRLQALGDAPAAAALWLERLARSQACWLWLDAPPAPEDAWAHALLAWCEHAAIPIVMAGSADEEAWLASCHA